MSADAYLLGLAKDPPVQSCPFLARLTRLALELLESEAERVELLNEVLPQVDAPSVRGEAFTRRYRAVAPMFAIEVQPILLRAQASHLYAQAGNDQFLKDLTNLRELPELGRPLRYMARLGHGSLAADADPMLDQAFAHAKGAAEKYPEARSEIGRAVATVVRRLIALTT